MARVTKADLEEQLKELEERFKEQLEINMQLNKTISDMQERADNNFDNSPMCRQMEKQIKHQETIIKGYEISIKAKDVSIKNNRDTIEELLNNINSVQKSNTEHIEELEAKNENLENIVIELTAIADRYKNRNAGRKVSITAELKARVIMLHMQGLGYRAIAKDCNISLGSVSKIINEQGGN